MDRLKGEGRGNAGLWTPRKTKGRFSTAPTALGNRCAIPTFPPPRLSVEKWKTKSRFPTFPLVVYAFKTRFRKEAWRQSLRFPLQAHSSMRKCYSDAASVYSGQTKSGYEESARSYHPSRWPRSLADGR